MSKRCLFLLIPIVSLIVSCSTTGCYDETKVNVYCSFYSLSDEKAGSLDSLSVWGVGSDSLVYDNEKLSKLALELNPTAAETRYVVQAIYLSNVFTDTLTFIHTNRPWFQSKDCDCVVFSTLDTCLTTGGLFQSASIIDHEIINYETTHVVLNL